MNDPKKAWAALFPETETRDQTQLRREAKLKAKRKLALKRCRKSRGSAMPACSLSHVTRVVVPGQVPTVPCRSPKQQAEDFENCERWWAYTRPRPYGR